MLSLCQIRRQYLLLNLLGRNNGERTVKLRPELSCTLNLAKYRYTTFWMKLLPDRGAQLERFEKVPFLHNY
jgi:hypothetical protein